jgi:succinate-semialdehyde dehydrogenase / glutarate-semialdehyde dehydrogenase
VARVRARREQLNAAARPERTQDSIAMPTSAAPISTTYSDVSLLIDGEWCASASGRKKDVLNPASGARIGTVALADPVDLERAAQAARRGFEAWRKVSAAERAGIMRRAANLVRERSEEIARLMTLEQGKPIVEAIGEVRGSAEMIDWFADEGQRVYGRTVPSRNAAMQQFVFKEPIGPVVAFSPWNFPINQIVRKLAPALACGCSIIVKAPEETPASAAALLRAFADAGVPKGAIGLVFGEPATISNYLIAHPLIRKVTFTGSTAVGKQLASLAGLHMKRVTMELGGHAPVIVAEDADLGMAIRILGATKFHNAGQVCISPTRFLVHNSVRPEFEAAMVRHAESLCVGDGLDQASTMGPLANARRLLAMQAIVFDASSRGAKVATGGDRLGTVGNFFAPTVLTDVPLDAEVFNSEPFGPLVAVRGFDDLDEAITEANRLPFGLAGYAFTRSIKTLRRLSQEVEVGMLYINQPPTPSAEMPFGGVKDSGDGSEGGPEALASYLTTKAVSVMSY